ncbi:hypothetical protein PR001_g23731 [Phytophthora rubi]|uniref:Reverse transcriptase Ty1/copia-type domain-containing protein n=1 Tax=Phytophthora rubi TaxID=129364 RepID=A0A6A3ISI5_9STRA|nr:hypothetical protein PR001_g23731 [Phytophthora rubi]
MKDEDGELHNVMLFAAEGDLNCYPIDWYANSIYTDKDDTNILIGWIIENNDFTADQPQGWTACNRCRGDWIASCADGSAKQCKASKTLSVMPLSELQLLRNVNAHEQVASALVQGSSQVLNSTCASFELIAEIDHDCTSDTLMIKQTRFIDDAMNRFNQQYANAVVDPCESDMKLMKIQSPATNAKNGDGCQRSNLRKLVLQMGNGVIVRNSFHRRSFSQQNFVRSK